MNMQSVVRLTLLTVQGLVAVTAFAGGAALVLGSFDPQSSLAIIPPAQYLEGSPFVSYLVPGIALAVGLGGTHLAAFVVLLRRHPLAMILAAVAAFAALIWIFVQMVFIPFSFLQVLYFGAGLAEMGMIMLALGILHRAPVSERPHERLTQLEGRRA